MADAGTIIEQEVLDAPAAPVGEAKSKRTYGDVFREKRNPARWEWQERGTPKIKWWTFWRWKWWQAGPPSQSPVPGLTNLMKVDDRSLDIMQTWANLLAAIAVCSNVALVATYAFLVSTQSELPLTRNLDFVWNFLGWDWHIGTFARYAVIVILALVGAAIAICMQFTTDFCIPFANGLAGEKLRFIPPVAAYILFPLCLYSTVIMKMDVFYGWGREREAASVEMKTANANDQAILEKYASKIPPPIADSEANVAKADAAITNADDAIKRLTTARAEQAAFRTKEEDNQFRPGRGQLWAKHNAAVEKIDADIAGQGVIKAAAVTERASALAAKAARAEYDGAKSRTEGAVRGVTESERTLLYDQPMMVTIRAVTMAMLSPVMVLMSFMLRSTRAERSKRSGAAQQGVVTKRRKKNTRDTEWEEGDVLPAALIGQGDLASEADLEPARMGRAKPANQSHPDKAGDGAGVGADPRRETTVLDPSWLDGDTLDEGGLDGGR